MLVQLLSRQVFSHFGELWLMGSHGTGITSRMSYIRIAPGKKCLDIQITPGKKTSRQGSLDSRNMPWLCGAVGIGGDGVA